METAKLRRLFFVWERLPFHACPCLRMLDCHRGFSSRHAPRVDPCQKKLYP